MTLYIIGSGLLFDSTDKKIINHCVLLDVLDIEYIDFDMMTSDYYWFASPHAIKSLIHKNKFSYILKSKSIGVVGLRSKNLLIQLGVSELNILCFKSLDNLVSKWDKKGEIVFFRVSGACKNYSETLDSRVKEVVVYKTIKKELSIQPKFKVDDQIIFTSPRSYNFFIQDRGDIFNQELKRHLSIYTLGKKTHNELIKNGFNNITISEKPSLNYLIEKILNLHTICDFT